jgi:hypothetical protein
LAIFASFGQAYLDRLRGRHRARVTMIIHKHPEHTQKTPSFRNYNSDLRCLEMYMWLPYQNTQSERPRFKLTKTNRWKPRCGKPTATKEKKPLKGSHSILFITIEKPMMTRQQGRLGQKESTCYTSSIPEPRAFLWITPRTTLPPGSPDRLKLRLE